MSKENVEMVRSIFARLVLWWDRDCALSNLGLDHEE
jgi:hypothetical protein